MTTEAISPMTTTPPFAGELLTSLNQLHDEVAESMQLARQSPDLDDLSAVHAVALLKIGMAIGLVEQQHPGFAKEVENKRQRVIAALQAEQPKH
jgi:hypothetical protein